MSTATPPKPGPLARARDFITRFIHRHPLRAATIALTLLANVIVWSIGAFWWSSHDSISWQECVYGNSGCSTAAATWALAAFGIFTFLAAYRAVFWAKQAFEIEVEPRLGQSVCAHDQEDDHPADKSIFLTADGQILFRKPAVLTKEALKKEYVPYPNAFENLGRSALSEIHVKMHIRDANGKMSDPIDVVVGNIKCDKEVHLVVYVSSIFKPVEIMWSDATERGKAIDFYPESALEDTVEVGLNPPDDDGTPHEQIQLPLADAPKSGGDAPKANAAVETSFQSPPSTPT